MMKRQGFTLIELMLSLAMTAVLTGMVIFIFIACFRSWGAGEARAQLRTELSQAMELMVKDLHHAAGILNVAADTISFSILEDGKKVDYWFYVGSTGAETYQLHQGLDKEKGPVILSGLQSKDVFKTTDNRMFTIDLTGVREGTTIHMRTNVTARDL